MDSDGRARTIAGDSKVPSRIVQLVRRNGPLVTIDVAIVAGTYLALLVLRFNGSVPRFYWTNFARLLPVIVAIHILANHGFGVYGQMWRYASVWEARGVVRAGLVAAVAVVAIDLGIGIARGNNPVPVSVAISGALVTMLGFGGVRFQTRLFGFRRHAAESRGARALLVGAGDAGSMILREILANPTLGLAPVGLVDDDPRKLGRSLHGVRVLGPTSEIPDLIERLSVDQVLLTIPSASGEVVSGIADMCDRAGVALRVLPPVREVVGGRVTARDVRDLRIEDLLGRLQVQTDLDAVAGVLAGRRVLVTGAGGSIGSEISRQVAALRPDMLVLLDRDESLLHEVVLQVDGLAPVQSVLADIRDERRVFEAFMDLRPDVVFHAAAHKHVPILERFPREALLTNVIGTATVVDAAVAAGAERFVLISTDKAVRPAGAMGASKWFAEQIVRSLASGRCIACSVRFGNVLGSRGSVIPTFLEQIRRGGPITVTDPSMTRFFMSVQEAVQLVLQAAALAEGAEVFTLDMGEPVNILDLARRLVRLSGRIPDRDVPIAIVGPRPGEKLMEELVAADEDLAPTLHSGIFVSHPPVPDRPVLRAALRELQGLADDGGGTDLRERMVVLAGRPLRPPVPEAIG